MSKFADCANIAFESQPIRLQYSKRGKFNPLTQAAGTKMAKGKGRKRKLAQTTSSEESSSQSQGPKELPEESRPPARYAPKFGNPSKKAKLVLRKTQDDSCTQPEKVVMEGFTDTLVSATQPVPKQYASQMVSPKVCECS